MGNRYRKLLTSAVIATALSMFGALPARAEQNDMARELIRPKHNVTVDTASDKAYTAAAVVVHSSRVGLGRLFHVHRAPHGGER